MLLTGINHLNEPAPDWWSRLGYPLEPIVATEAVAEVRARFPEPALQEAAGIASAAVLDGLALAQATATDGLQRAIGVEIGGLAAVYERRLELRRACRAEPAESPLRRVQPWLWSARTSGGSPMTEALATATRSGCRARDRRCRSSRYTG
jgi:hypothetical protein